MRPAPNLYVNVKPYYSSEASVGQLWNSGVRVWVYTATLLWDKMVVVVRPPTQPKSPKNQKTKPPGARKTEKPPRFSSLGAKSAKTPGTHSVFPPKTPFGGEIDSIFTENPGTHSVFTLKPGPLLGVFDENQ